MSKVTYKNLFTLVDDLITERLSYNTQSPYKDQAKRAQTIAPLAMSSTRTADVSANELVRVVQTMIAEALPSRIIEGLAVTAAEPISKIVHVSAGKGVANGTIYTLYEDITLNVPLDYLTHVFYVSLYRDTITFEKNEDKNKLIIAKIVCPIPQLSERIRDKYDGSPDAYIQQYRTYNLYGDENGYFEEETVELLRDNIGEILADNLIGNIRLSENLKITNTAGTLELDSNSLKLMDEFDRVLSKFNRKGIYFYNTSGQELAKFATDGARVGNITILPNAIQSNNFLSGSIGFQLKDTGDVEFNNLTVRGTVYALAGKIGGWTIADDMLYADGEGIIQTGANVGAGQNGVKLDQDGLHVYDDVLGRVVYFPSDGSAPQISSGRITEVIYEISTNSILRTSETVGDGTSLSYGILINNTGLYGCGANQLLQNANLKALVDGTVSITGEITASSGAIGGTTITETLLSGGTIEGSTIRGSIIETSSVTPKIRIDSSGLYYQVSGTIGKYGSSASGSLGFQYGDGTKYGSGVLAYLFNTSFPTFSIISEDANHADVRLYNRLNPPATGTHVLGDLAFIDGYLTYCVSAGSPGTFVPVGGIVENRTSDPTSPEVGRIWFRTDI